MKKVFTSPLDLPELLSAASKLKLVGQLAVSLNNLTYLDIQDEFIHQLFPLLKKPDIYKPNYFGENLAGAHITVIYPEEKVAVDKSDLAKEHHFTVKDACAAQLNAKTYYVLMVEAPSLLQLRKKYGLPKQLNFKNHLIDFHITMGVSSK